MPTPRKFQFLMNYPRTMTAISVGMIFMVAALIAVGSQNIGLGIWFIIAVIGAVAAFVVWGVFAGYGPGGKHDQTTQDPTPAEEPSRITVPSWFNTNHEVKVKLTEYGLAIYKEYLAEQDRLLRPKFADRTDKLLESQRAQPDKDGYFKLQMYVLMHIFGGEEHMPDTATSRPIPFETEIILLPSP